MDEITGLLQAWSGGDERVLDALIPQVGARAAVFGHESR
jgi:hypothetical protein